MQDPTAALLGEAARLHGRGALEDAASRYRQVLQHRCDHPLALYHLAVIACQQGRFPEGIELARRSLLGDPQQPRAHNLVGMALSRLGRHHEALASFENALAQQGDFADAHGNRGNVLLELGRAEEAVASLERAVALEPRSPGDWLNLGTALHQLGRHAEAIASYDRVLALQAGFAPAHCNRGNVLAQLGRYEEAIASYDQALAGNRGYADALVGRAQVLLELGRIEGALVNFEEALAAAPEHPRLLGRLVRMLTARGEIVRALAVLSRLLSVRETSEAKALFVDCVRNRPLSADPGGARPVLAKALSDPWDRPADLAVPSVSLIKLNPAIANCCARAARMWPQRPKLADLSGSGLAPQLAAEGVQKELDLSAIADDQLLRVLLETVPVCDATLERCLTGLRAVLLESAAADQPPAHGLLCFYCALARQCFINEYVFDANRDELERVRHLHDRLIRSLGCGEDVAVLALIAVAAYLPLHSLPGAETWLDCSWPPPVAALLDQQLREPLHERQLRASIPALTVIADEVSLAVKQQYEQNPYPRWVKPAPVGEPKTMAQYFGAWCSRSAVEGPIDILVAGCGTGQNLVETAREFKLARVLAVDLSVASLCYAKRQASALGLGHIEFAEADILELANIGRSFDIIDASGVLHHMADPWAGARLLLSLLRPGGFMRLGLYSKLARSAVNVARAFVAERGFSSTPDDIRRSRQAILDLAHDHPAKTVTRYLDFFTTSECRDMLLHVQEHQLTVPELSDFLTRNELDFLSFITDAGVASRFRARFPQEGALRDPDLWHLFETENPDTFAGMYQFWVRKNN